MGKFYRLTACAALLVLHLGLSAQTYFSTQINGTVINLPCNANCTDFHFKVPHLKTSSEYTLVEIPCNPYPFVTGLGTELSSLYLDDKYSPSIPLPFPFCFYDSLYTAAVVGSNALITFDVTNANCANAYSIMPPIPSAGTGGQCVFSTYYPKAALMIAYSDMDGGAVASAPDRKIEWRLEGTAPFRRLVVSYYHIGAFGNTTCNSTGRASLQIVIYESTGLIEFYVLSKPCSPYNGSGRTILGIQNWARNKGVAAPGKNATVWNESNKAYQFVPSGQASRFIKSELCDFSGNVLATTGLTPGADTITTTTGLLDVNFPNQCFTSNSQQLLVKTYFSSCSDPMAQFIARDTVYVNKQQLASNVTASPANCALNGSISLNIPSTVATPPFNFTVDGGSPVTANTSSYTITGLGSGAHTVEISAGNGCTQTLNVTVPNTGSLSVNSTAAAPSCLGGSTGSITITPVNGVAPFTYSLNNGSFGSSNYLNNLAAGNYTVSIHDGSGCQLDNVPIVIPAGAPLQVVATGGATGCPGASNGSVTMTPQTGAAPYAYNINGGSFQTGNVLSNLTAGNYVVSIQDAQGCSSGDVNVTVPAGNGITANLTTTAVACAGGSSGTVQLANATGAGPYQYSLNNGAFQNGSVISNLSAGNYTVNIKDAAGCVTPAMPVTITQPAALGLSASTVGVTCNGLSTGQINAAASGGSPGYQYSINGTSFQASPNFNVAAGNYTVTVKDINNCTNTFNAAVTQPAVLTASAVTAAATCAGGADGQINVTATGGTSPYQYGLSGANYQSSNVIADTAGTFTVTVKDANNCVYTLPAQTVALNNNLTFTPLADQTICEGSSAQLNFTSNGTVYNWTGGPVSTASVNNPTVNPTTTTDYVVKTTLGVCSTTDTVRINVNAAPIADAGPDGDICFGQNYTLQGSGGVQYQWTPTTSLTGTGSSPVSQPNSTITYSLNVTDANGCGSLTADQVTVQVTPPIQIQLISDTIVPRGDVFQLHATAAANSFSWSPAFGLSNAQIADPVVTALDDIIYTVNVTDATGCLGSASIRLKVYNGPEIYVPTAWTPNGDGRNDKLYPFPVGIKKLNYFKVFNRWGQMVFSTTTLMDGWDGRINGVQQAMGTFVWVVEGVTKDDRVIRKTGTATLIR